MENSNSTKQVWIATGYRDDGTEVASAYGPSEDEARARLNEQGLRYANVITERRVPADLPPPG